MMHYTVRPISDWPAGERAATIQSPFRASYGQSEDKLIRELDHLEAENVVLEIDVRPHDLRLDGTLRANAKPQGPRVMLYADTKFGPLSMPCGTYHHWHDNVRAIALSLEALRAVDRYGCSNRGQQYRGWTAIPATTSITTRVEAAWTLLKDQAGWSMTITPDMRVRELLDRLFRDAVRKVHPDAGGSDELMVAVNRARDLILVDLTS